MKSRTLGLLVVLLGTSGAVADDMKMPVRGGTGLADALDQLMSILDGRRGH